MACYFSYLKTMYNFEMLTLNNLRFSIAIVNEVRGKTKNKKTLLPHCVDIVKWLH